MRIDETAKQVDRMQWIYVELFFIEEQKKHSKKCKDSNCPGLRLTNDQAEQFIRAYTIIHS